MVEASCILTPHQPSCDVNAKDSGDLTPLHIAAHEGYPVMVERLVGYGADLNSTTEGTTCLHLTLGRSSMAAPSELSPRILEVHTYMYACIYVYTCVLVLMQTDTQCT